MSRHVLLSGIILLLFQCTNSTQKSTVLPKNLGELQYDFVIEDSVRANFDKGLLLLHNFEYDDARDAFRQGLLIDSTEIMLHWGEAMTAYKALWGLQDVEAGRTIIERLGASSPERLAKIDDLLEKDFWRGLEILYGEGTFKERNQKYAAYMQKLHNKYPNNQEVAAFYALSLIWATEEYGDGSADLIKAAKIADAILDKNPNHPGALHYKIHALDGPVSADLAEAAADAYAKVAPDAAHALHMPSHIYLALGHWDDVVASNEASYAASVKRMEKLGLSDGARGYHSYAWLHYGLLQQGRYQDAERLLKDMLTYVPRDPTKGARVYLLGMQSRQLAEAKVVDDETPIDMHVKVDDLGLEAQAMHAYLNAQIAHNNGDKAKLEELIHWLEGQEKVAATLVGEDGLAMCSSGATRYAPTQNILAQTEVILNQMQAMHVSLDGDWDLYGEYLKTATEIEAETDYPTGPPRITHPSFEQYGNWLLEQQKYEAALTQFDLSLQRTPRRTQSLHGKMTALHALNKKEEANLVEAELKSIWKKADPAVRDVIAAL